VSPKKVFAISTARREMRILENEDEKYAIASVGTKNLFRLFLLGP